MLASQHIQKKKKKTTKSKNNTRTTALERSVEKIAVGFKALLQLAQVDNWVLQDDFGDLCKREFNMEDHIYIYISAQILNDD